MVEWFAGWVIDSVGFVVMVVVVLVAVLVLSYGGGCGGIGDDRAGAADWGWFGWNGGYISFGTGKARFDWARLSTQAPCTSRRPKLKSMKIFDRRRRSRSVIATSPEKRHRKWLFRALWLHICFGRNRHRIETCA